MAKRDSANYAPPPLLQKGYVLFVKLWDVSPSISADTAFALFGFLDALLLDFVKHDLNKWFPSPYGGAVVLYDVEAALRVARGITQQTAKKGVLISIGIAYGNFERVHSVTRWNTAALAINFAARMANNQLAKGRVTVEPRVRNDAILIRESHRAIFGDLSNARVKRTTFQYHVIVEQSYVQELAARLTLPSTKKKSRLADVVLFDIERYSEKPASEQSRAADTISRCVELALTGLGGTTTLFGPAGDGGYLAFIFNDTGSTNSAWTFARHLREHAQRENLAIRIGIASGPILVSTVRSVVGGVVLKADAVSSFAPAGGIAVSSEFWENLATELRFGWSVASVEEDGSIVVLGERGQVVNGSHYKNVDVEASSLLNRTLWTLRDEAVKNRSLLLIIILIAILAFVVWSFVARKAKDSTANNPMSSRADQPLDTAIKSIAVLPFFIESPGVDDYLSEELANELNTRLTRMPGLRVAPISSVLRYKGRIPDPKEVSQELRVEAVITGRIERRKTNLIIKIELVDLRTAQPKQIKFEQIERNSSVLLATEEQIVTKIVQGLGLNLSGEDRMGLNKRYTNNDAANELYMKGRHYLSLRTRDGTEKAINCFEQAIRLDGSYALAYLGKAEALNIMAGRFLPPREAIEEATLAAQKAKSLDPTLAEARTALGTSLAMKRDWLNAEWEFKEGLRLDSKSASQHWRYALYYLIPKGRTHDAVEELKKAVDLDPDSLIVQTNCAAMYIFDRKYEVALNQALEVHKSHPEFLSGRFILGLAYNAASRYDAAITLSEEVLKNDPTNQLFLYTAGYAYAKTGRKAKANEVIKSFESISESRHKQHVVHYFVATIYAALGRTDEAFDELRKALNQNDFYLLRLKADPFVESLQNDRRFGDLVKDMGLL